MRDENQRCDTPKGVIDMPRYAALLRGVSPMNAAMPDLKRAFEAAGFTDVKTVLASGNVIFTAEMAPVARLQAEAEAAMQKHLGRSFLTIVRPINGLQTLLESNPFKRFEMPNNSKRIVTFLRDAPGRKLRLPIEKDGARILVMRGGAAFGAYVPTPKGPVFMSLLERTFGKAQTTRTWQTLERIVVTG
jgi:uncharacterized protein (DUF1697 family)